MASTPSTPPLDSIVDKIIEVASEGRPRVCVCAACGISCEGWLKVELLHAIAGSLASHEEITVLPEANNVDLTVRTATKDILIELKTFPTNYGRSGKPITNFIQGVVDDLNKLAAKTRKGHDNGLAVWMAYPIPEPVPTTWPAHLAKVTSVAATTLRSHRIPLWKSAFAYLYVMQSL